MILWRNLKDRRNRESVSVDGVPDQLGNVLINEDDVDVVALDELLEAILDVGHGRIWNKSIEISLVFFLERIIWSLKSVLLIMTDLISYNIISNWWVSLNDYVEWYL